MALRTVGSKSATQLACLTSWSPVIPSADLGAIGAQITADRYFGSYVQATATTAGSTALTAVAARSGSPPPSQILPGDLVIGSAADIVPGTCVTAVSGGGANLTLSQAAVSSGTGKGVMFVRGDGYSGIQNTAQLLVPGRGILKVLPGDIVAVDASGWPILLSATAISYLSSDWTLT